MVYVDFEDVKTVTCEPGLGVMDTATTDDAHVIYGTACDQSLGNPLRVTVLPLA